MYVGTYRQPFYNGLQDQLRCYEYLPLDPTWGKEYLLHVKCTQVTLPDLFMKDGWVIIPHIDKNILT